GDRSRHRARDGRRRLPRETVRAARARRARARRAAARLEAADAAGSPVRVRRLRHRPRREAIGHRGRCFGSVDERGVRLARVPRAAAEARAQPRSDPRLDSRPQRGPVRSHRRHADLALEAQARGGEPGLEPGRDGAQRRLSVDRPRNAGRMSIRHSLAARIGLIVVVSLVVALLGAIAIARLADAPDAEAAPLAGRIAALVSALEEAPADQHERILRAASSRFFAARVEPTTDAEAAPGRIVSRRIARRIDAEPEALGYRPSSLTVTHASDGGRGVEYRIGLETGDTLVVRVGRAGWATILGAPAFLVTGLFGILVALLALLAMHR